MADLTCNFFIRKRWGCKGRRGWCSAPARWKNHMKWRNCRVQGLSPNQNQIFGAQDLAIRGIRRLAFKITSEQVSSVLRANPLPRQKVRVTGQRCYFRNPCHLLSSTVSKNHSPNGGVGTTKATTSQAGGRPGPAPATEATARVPSIPAREHRCQGPKARSGDQAAAPGGNRSDSLGLAGPGPAQTPQGRAAGRQAPGRERRRARSPRSILRRAEEAKAGLGTDRAGHFSGLAESSPGNPGL